MNNSLLVSGIRTTFSGIIFYHLLLIEMESDSLIVPSPESTVKSNSSQTSEQEREETKKFLQDIFAVSTEKNETGSSVKHCWLETTARPPVRKRTTNIFHQKISAQIICQDIEDETSFVKLVFSSPLIYSF